VLIDISRPIRPGMGAWPGDPPFEFEWASSRARGDPVNVGLVRMGLHTGTHLDAPLHTLDDAMSTDRIPLEHLVGPAVVVDAREHPTLDVSIARRVLERWPNTRRLLFRTGAWTSQARFPAGWPSLQPEGASLLVRSELWLVGTDAPSVDPIDSIGLPAHQSLLSPGICILENLALDEVSEGEYDLIALPLPILGADASPVRAVLRPR
jgi:arylformamidase